MSAIKKTKVSKEKEPKEVKKRKMKIKRDGKLKHKEFNMVEVGGGFTPRDTAFPPGETQLFTPEEVEELSK